MTDTCPNCGKPALPTDTVCWHCGYQLPKRPKAARPEAARRDEVPGVAARGRETSAPEPADYDFRALLVYGLLTLAVLVGLWLVMRSLSRQPILVRNAAFDLGGNWVAVTDVDLRYTLSLPTDWQWLDVAYRDQGEVLQQLIARQPYIDRALRPLGDATDDLRILAVGLGTPVLEETEPQPFVVVGQSEALRGMSPEAVLDALADQPLPVSDQSIDTRLAGQPQARFGLLDISNSYQCRHLVASDESAAYLVAACAPQARVALVRRTLNDILDSFQLLEH